MVFSGLVMLWRLAGCPTSTSPLSVKATIEGVVRAPSAFSMTFAEAPSMTATQELVVPRSMPIALLIAILQIVHAAGFRRNAVGSVGVRSIRRRRRPPPHRFAIADTDRNDVRGGRSAGVKAASRRAPTRAAIYAAAFAGAFPGSFSASLTSIFLASVCAGFGILICSTPLDIVASTVEGSIFAGSSSAR